MQTDYWKSTEVQPSFKDWKEFREGCIACACDHGCNAWVKEQEAKSSLFFDILTNKNATTSLDKVAKMPLERANKIWYRIFRWRMYRANREMNEQIRRENEESKAIQKSDD